MDTFIVKFGPRIKKVEVALEEPFSFKYVLERAIRKLMECDPFMKNRASSGFFMTQYSEQSKLSIEIDDATKYWDIDPNLPIELMLFESINFEIPTRKTTEPAALPTTADPITPSVLSYMDRLGLVVHHDPALVTPSPTAVTRGAGTSTAAAAPKSTPAARAHNSRSSNTPSSSKTAVCDSSKPSTSNPSTSNPSTSGQILYSPQPSRKKKSRVAQSDDESDGEGEYLERVLQRREQNRAVLEQLVPSDAPKLRPATRKQGKKKGKENIEPRIMPSRAAKQKVPSANENQTGDDEEMEEQERISQEDTLINDGPIASHSGRKTVQVNVVGNFHKKKNHKLIGTVITKATPLPEFPKALKGSLERGIYNTRQMNAFLKSHVANISKDRKGQITKAEYKNLSVQVTNRFASMNFAHADTYRLKIKKKLSDSLRAARYYPKKRAARRAAAQRRRDEASRNQTTTEGEENPRNDETEEPADQADAILQKPVVNRKSVRMCISSSTQRIPFIKTHSVEEVILKYPYLKEADLLIYEYSTRVPLPLKKLQENFLNSLPSLAHILDGQTPDEDDELGKVMIYHGIEKFYSGGEEHLPSIQFCEAANRNAVPLNNIPVGQAPAVVIVKDGSKILQSASLIFDGSVLTTASNPTAFDCVALLLSGYWVFEISYPAPYLQHMESFEAILHGNVTAKASTLSRHSKMDEFFRKLIIASPNLD